MKRITYLFVALISAFAFVACEDNDNGTHGMTQWEYSKPYFEFEYVMDTVKFGMPGQEMKYATQDLKTLFEMMAGEKMGDYFKGINFYSKDSLAIRAQMASGIPFEIHAAYLQDDHYIEVTLDSKSMAAIMGNKASLIPSISMHYFVKDQEMTIYLDEVYIQSIFENIQIQNMLIPLLARTLNPRFEQMPEKAQQGMMTVLKQQISGILDNIQTLKLGFVLH